MALPPPKGDTVRTTADWNVYRTRFLIKARQLDAPLEFVDPLGRQHCGRIGDYLIESSDGWRSIQRKEIFEDVYVPMNAPSHSWTDSLHPGVSADEIEQTIAGRPAASA